jgi:catechol 2,3-dioxygenase-like lactoylglutathione lyase family enzyme
MPHHLKKLTPNLVVADVARSVAFYRDVLGFAVATTVPETPPYAFAIVQHGAVEVFLNAREPAVAEYPAFTDRPIGGTFTKFIEVSGIAEMYDALAGRVPIVMPLEE